MLGISFSDRNGAEYAGGLAEMLSDATSAASLCMAGGTARSKAEKSGTINAARFMVEKSGIIEAARMAAEKSGTTEAARMTAEKSGTIDATASRTAIDCRLNSSPNSGNKLVICPSKAAF